MDYGSPSMMVVCSFLGVPLDREPLYSEEQEVCIVIYVINTTFEMGYQWLPMLPVADPGFPWGVLVLLICVQILVRLDCFSHIITMEV